MSLHHWSTLEGYEAKHKKWKDHTDVIPGEVYCENSSFHNRCGQCWLRRRQCYCKTANARRDYYLPKLESEYANCEIIMYYHFLEIGRSANTAHVFQMLCPGITRTLMFGDVENETKLFDAMQAEAESEAGLRTCILYPGSTAVLLHDWIAEQEEKDQQAAARAADAAAAVSVAPVADDDPDNYWAHNPKRKYRIIALDGTYGQANKLMKHIENTLTGRLSERAMRKLQGCDDDSSEGAPDGDLNRFVHNRGVRKPLRVKPVHAKETPFYVPHYNIPVPVVKLYLGPSGGCKSAIAGIMYQPRKDTLCTFQALVMALEQANKAINQMRGTFAAGTETGATPTGRELASELDDDLSQWLEYMLTEHIKIGKSRQKHGVSEQRDENGDMLTEGDVAFISAVPERENIRRFLVGGFPSLCVKASIVYLFLCNNFVTIPVCRPTIRPQELLMSSRRAEGRI
jgi:DTW domain-containing protein YfiP